MNIERLPESVANLMEKSNMWSYAQLSHNAKITGGPNEFISKIATESYVKGYLDGASEVINQIVKFVSIAKK